VWIEAVELLEILFFRKHAGRNSAGGIILEKG